MHRNMYFCDGGRIVGGSRQNRGRIATIAVITAEYSEVGLQLFFISHLCPVFS